MMKKYISAGRDPEKLYRDLKFTGWTRTKTDILEQCNQYLADPQYFMLDELKRYVRYAISEAEDAAERLYEYRDILEDFNRSSASEADVQNLISNLKKFRFQNIHASKSISASSSMGWKKFAKENFDSVLTWVNDTTHFYGERFRDACIDEMIERMDEAGITYPDDVDWYLADMFWDYGEE